MKGILAMLAGSLWLNLPWTMLLVWTGLAVLPRFFGKDHLPFAVGLFLIVGGVLGWEMIRLPAQAVGLAAVMVCLTAAGTALLLRNSKGSGAARDDSQLRDGLFFLLTGVAFSLIALKSAWICDDAYITFRTVDNFVHGLGLTWNPDERVQTYTHPLWMFILAAARLVSGKIYYSAVFLNVLFSLAAVLLIAVKIARTEATAVFAVLILSLSKAFVDFSTSGLENALTYLCLAVFFVLYWRGTWKAVNYFWLCAAAGLGVWNRMDTLLLYLPALAVAAWSVKRQIGRRWLGIAAAGFAPFLLWEIFSLWYYGFLFPNTAYAKLNTGIAGAQLLASGWHYLVNSMRLDPITLTVILLGLAAPWFAADKGLKATALGIALYLAYVIHIGGDFMSGRFLAAPLMCAVMILARALPAAYPYPAAAALAVVLGLVSPYNPWASGADYRSIQAESPEAWSRRVWSELIDRHGIADERAYYYPITGLLKVPGEDRWDFTSAHPLIIAAEQGKALARDGRRRILVGGCAGLEGYYAGPQIHFLDFMALCDPLLARLPAKPNCRVGHYEREIPQGYIETIITGENVIADPKIAGLYRQLATITQGPWLRWSRLKAIVRLNFGRGK